MRRQLNLAGLIQYILMISLAGLLVGLVMAGASPQVFAIALLGGALLAASPAIYIVTILLPRQTRGTQQVRQQGLPASAEVLRDGEGIAADFQRHAGAYKNLPILLEVPVRVHPASAQSAYPAQMSTPLPLVAQLKPGMWLGARYAPGEPSRVMPADDQDGAPFTWTIRPVQGADLPSLAELIRLAFAEQRGVLDPPAGAFEETAESLRARLESSNGLLAEVRSTPVGCIFYREEAGHLHLSRLAVLPEYRRQGIGHSLLAQAEQVARQAGFRQVRLGVRAEISTNREYYQRLGYRVIEEASHDGYTKITVYILEKELLSPHEITPPYKGRGLG